MSENNSISDESYSDDEEEEELDPRIQDELEKLNAATNSINHLEAELDEARAVFRQTLAGATYQLNGVAQKLGKCVEKSRPFYEAYRQLRQSHSMLQRSTNQFERATGMHIAAKNRVGEAERRVFGGGAKRAFDSALQEMLNQATIEVNEAEKMKRDSWKKHQEDLLAYRDLEAKVKHLYKKLKNPVEKAKPYFEQKKDFDRHLWQLKLRVDSIHLGLSGAKENYSSCLKSLEVISDEIHEKRKSKRMEAMIAKLQEREAGVGADSSTEDETSLTASNLDLDFDSNVNFAKLDGIGDNISLQAESVERTEIAVAGCVDDANTNSSFPSVPLENRVVYGLESSEDTALMASAGNESEPGKGNSQLPDKVSSLEEPNHSESVTKTEDEPTSSLENVASSNAPSIQSVTKNLSQEESISTLENETTHEENSDKNEESSSNDFCVTVTVDEMVSSDTMKGEDSITATNEALTAQVETENKEKASIIEESELLENEDNKETQSERHEIQNEKENETDIERNEGQNDIDGREVLATNDDDDEGHKSDDDAKEAENVKNVTERTEKNEACCDSESNEMAEQDKEDTNDDTGANAENITEEKQTNDSEIKEKVEDKQVSDDGLGANTENITEVIDSDSEIKENIAQDKDVTNDDTCANAENFSEDKQTNDSEIKENVEQDKEATDHTDTGANAENTTKANESNTEIKDQE